MRSGSETRRSAKLDRFPICFRETIDWIIGRTRRKNSGPSKVTNQPIEDVSSAERGICDGVDEALIDKFFLFLFSLQFLRFTTRPAGVDPCEWLASHTLSLFDLVNSLCGCLTDVCTPVTCPLMSYPGAPKAYYVDEKGKRHQYSAMQYIDTVMASFEASARNEQLFPTRHGGTFPPNFQQHCARALRLLWHCLGHICAKHWDVLGTLKLRSQAALVLHHLCRLMRKESLLEEDEQRAIEDTVRQLRPARRSRVPAAKSGSWGGRPTPAALPAPTPMAHTC